MTNETLYRAIGDISETYIAQAHTRTKPKHRALMHLGAVAAALCLLVGGALLSNLMGGLGNGGGFFGSGDATVFAAHREDFNPEIDSAILAQFDDPTEVKKAYLMRTNEWFLADDLTDFSQAVTTDIVYVVPGGEKLSDTAAAYSTYSVGENGALCWGSTAYPPDSVSLPFGFSGLTYALIEHTLKDLTHEDYVITYAPQLGIVFLWVRGTAEGDVIFSYPTRPDFVGLENGGMYTLSQLQSALSAAYRNCGADTAGSNHSHQNGHHANDTHTQHTATRHFIHSMDCSNQNCTNTAHFHDCPSDCTDGAHYHNCPTDCTIASHGHPGKHTNENTNGNGYGHSSGHNNGHGNGHR